MILTWWLAKYWGSITSSTIIKSAHTAVIDQIKIRKKLVETAKKTKFGQAHNFNQIQTYCDFKKNITLHNYEDLIHYIDEIKNGDADVLWPGKPIYFAKSSGTTAGIKYIPITKDSLPNHITTARTALLLYVNQSKNKKFLDGKMIFLSGSPVLEKIGNILIGRLSGIVNHHIPSYLRSNQLPTLATNCIEDWEEKVTRIVAETKDKNMTLVSGIPPWMLMYFDQLKSKTGVSNIGQLFKNLQLIIYGGVSFEPYRTALFDAIGKPIDTLETYPASEGFLAFEAKGISHSGGLLLNTNSGIFFEFIDVQYYGTQDEKRIDLSAVKLNTNYALILNTNAGMWGYVIGDTVRFVSLEPYLIKVTGRLKHFISAFGEHVIAEEIDTAIARACAKHGTSVVEYHVAPMVTVSSGLPHHEWYIEFGNAPASIVDFSSDLDTALCSLNIYYEDLIKGKILQKCVIKSLSKNAFNQYMQRIGKLGGQNKVPRLLNDRSIATALEAFV